MTTEPFVDLIRQASAPNSDAILVLAGDEVAAQWESAAAAEPIETMSVTKSVVSMAIGRLLYQEYLDSVQVRLSTLYPAWQQEGKGDITIEHLLSHTSGLASERTTARIYEAGDVVQFALDSAVAWPPGAKFAYNNRAVNLLAGVVERLAGRPLDQYVAEELFAPLGIKRFSWTHDLAGNPYAMAGLAMRSVDLARLGQLMSAGGVWCGERLLPPGWLEQCTQAGEQFQAAYGLLWWLIPQWTRVVIDGSVVSAWCAATPPVPNRVIARLSAIKEQSFAPREFAAQLMELLGTDGVREFYDETVRRGLPDGRRIRGPTRGFYAEGELGQYLAVFPQSKLVAVRQRQRHGAWDTGNAFPDFVASVDPGRLRVCAEEARTPDVSCGLARGGSPAPAPGTT